MSAPTAAQVAAYLGQSDNEHLVALAGVHLPLITEMARTHTRGVGFTDGIPNEAIAAVIVSATARITSNPASKQMDQAGPFTTRYTVFQGWSLLERSVLDAHRRRAA